MVRATCDHLRDIISSLVFGTDLVGPANWSKRVETKKFIYSLVDQKNYLSGSSTCSIHDVQDGHSKELDSNANVFICSLKFIRLMANRDYIIGTAN